ncbi:MAG: phosphotyrosine protein phosphatase, partial [Caulobacteraceae bacterium]|nr:phosphotyrosine protein phosphatase [Caulobacteraceae bacterium]
AHRTRLTRRFGAHLRHARVICLDIPDNYGFMDVELVRLLEARAPGRLGL